MVDILGLVLRQFSSGSITGVCTQPGTGLCAPESGALVTGDRGFSRPLLLLSALTAASELAVKVLYFTPSQIQSLPISFQGARRAECLKKIRFVYPKTLEELLEDVASLHELVPQSGSLPSLLIVDGLEQYVCGPAAQDRTPQEAQSAAAHVVALLHDTAAFLTQKLGARAENQDQNQNQTQDQVQSQCRVIVSFQPEWEGQGGCPALVSDPILSVLERYLQVRCTTEKVRRGEEPNEWLFCLTGPGLQADGDGKSEERLQWRVVLKSNGTLDFCPISRVKEDTLETLQNPVEVKDD